MQSAIVVVIFRLENDTVDEKKYVVVRKIEKVVVSGSRRQQKTELQDHTARSRDVGLTLRHRRRRGQQSL